MVAMQSEGEYCDPNLYIYLQVSRQLKIHRLIQIASQMTGITSSV